MDTELSPRLASLLDGGRVAPLKLLGALVRSPGIVGELVRLARHTDVAARRLATTLTGEWEREATIRFVSPTPRFRAGEMYNKK